jgi:hypothetical protein
MHIHNCWVPSVHLLWADNPDKTHNRIPTKGSIFPICHIKQNISTSSFKHSYLILQKKTVTNCSATVTPYLDIFVRTGAESESENDVEL